MAWRSVLHVAANPVVRITGRCLRCCRKACVTVSHVQHRHSCLYQIVRTAGPFRLTVSRIVQF